MAYNAVALLHVRKKFYHQRFGGKKFLNKTNHPYPQLPPPSPSKFKWYSGIRFRLHVAQKEGKKNKATNQNLRYVLIYNIYIKFYILRQEIELGK